MESARPRAVFPSGSGWAGSISRWTSAVDDIEFIVTCGRLCHLGTRNTEADAAGS